MMNSQEWCIEQLEAKDRWRCLQLKRGRGGKRAFAGVTESDDIRSTCRGRVHFCFRPEEYHLLCDEFQRVKADLLELQINKRFTDRGLVMDGANFTNRHAEIDGKNGWLGCLFVPEREISNLCSFIRPWKKIRRLQLVPDAAAVAALLGSITGEAVLVFLLDRQKSQVLVVKGGIPLYSQALTQSAPGVIDEALIPHAVDFARVSVEKDFNIKDFHITCMGEARKSIDLGDSGLDQWQPDFSSVFDLDSQEDILDYPRLFGAGFVKESYDFLPKSFSTSWKLQSLAATSSIFAAIFTVALLGGWLLLQAPLKEKQLHYQNLSAAVGRQQQNIQDRLPSTASLDSFQRLVNIRAGATGDTRLDQLVGDLSLALPDKVHISELSVRRKALENLVAAPPPPGSEVPGMPGGAMGAPVAESAASIPERLQNQEVVIGTTCVTSGSYDEVTSRFEHVMVALNSVFNVEEMTWSYDETSNSGRLNCDLARKNAGGQP